MTEKGFAAPAPDPPAAGPPAAGPPTQAPAPASAAPVLVADDVCALPLARRMAALLDRDPASLRTGQPLPRGWHVLLFNPPTRQSDLRPDGAAPLALDLPQLDLPRLMFGGRRVAFAGDVPIGAAVRRETRRTGVVEKHGRSGRFAIVSFEHRVFVEPSDQPVLVETCDYLMRPAADAPERAPERDLERTPASPRPARPPAEATRFIRPDATMLFRYSAITDNAHRIHYDQPYATQVENYPRVLVNGSLPAMFLLELFRALAGREPIRFASRNIARMLCGETLRLNARANPHACTLWAETEAGEVTIEAEAA